MTVLEKIYAGGFSAYLHGYGAIDSWLGVKETGNNVFIFTNAGTADLAKLFEDLRFPGVDLADAALNEKNHTWYFRCADSFKDYHPSFSLLEFYRDCKSRVFNDPRGIYPVLKEIRNNIKTGKESIKPPQIITESFNNNSNFNRTLSDAALILAKYIPAAYVNDTKIKKYINEIKALFDNLSENSAPCPEEQRIFLCELITAANPGLGFELLKTCGFIKKFWPELSFLEQADHSKEYHPEGNAWEHTMETFRHRKTSTYDFRLSLGLLLHDMGKPIASSAGNNRYDGHAELGEIQAHRFLERLGFNSSIIRDVCFLVKNHMLPAALPRLPVYRTSEIMSSPLFPLLMELYRCDESSSFKGLDGYYESSATYQQFLRNKRNPWRKH